MSLVISADTQYLTATKGTPWWTSKATFSIAVWVKITTAQWGDIFTMCDGANSSYNVTALRTASGTTFDHTHTMVANDQRMSSSGTVAAGWNMVVLTFANGVGGKGYANGSLQQTQAGSSSLSWINGVGFDTVFFGYFASSTGYGQHSGRMKIAHGAVWDVELTSTQVTELWNGGLGGNGKNPTAVANSNLMFYAALDADATVTTGGVSLTATGSPTFDGADNPTVDAAGGGGGHSSLNRKLLLGVG